MAERVADATNKAVVTATAALRARLLDDETVKTVASLEPVALDVSKVVEMAVKDSGGDEATARTKIAQIVSDTTNEAVTAIAALRETLSQATYYTMSRKLYLAALVIEAEETGEGRPATAAGLAGAAPEDERPVTAP